MCSAAVAVTVPCATRGLDQLSGYRQQIARVFLWHRCMDSHGAGSLTNVVTTAVCAIAPHRAVPHPGGSAPRGLAISCAALPSLRERVQKKVERRGDGSSNRVIVQSSKLLG